jgi:uncharacterized Tic20 family protein
MAFAIHGAGAMPTQHPSFTYDEQADSAERQYAVFNHLAGMSSIMSWPFPMLGPVATLIMWRIRAKDSPFLDDHGREAFNFQLTMILWGLAAIPLAVPTLGLSIPAWFVLLCVGTIRAAVFANKGRYYRYPMCIRFFRTR